MTASSLLEIKILASGGGVLQKEIEAITGTFARLRTVLVELAPALAGLVSAGALMHLGEKFLEFSNQMSKAAQIVGTTAQAMAGLAYAAETDEVSVEALQKGLKFLSQYMVKSGQDGKSLTTVLLEQSKLFSQMEDGPRKIALATERFGKAGMALIPFLNKGPEEMARLIARGELLTGVTDSNAKTAVEFKDAMRDLKFATEGFAGAIALEVVPRLVDFVSGMTNAIVKAREFIKVSQGLRVAMEGVAVGVGVTATYFAASKGMGMLAGTFGAISTISDLVTALKMLPAAFAAAIASSAAVAIGIASATAVVVAGIEAFRLYKAQQQESASAAAMVDVNYKLADSIRKIVEAREADGRMTKVEADRYREFINIAMKHPGSADARLVPLSQSLLAGNAATPKKHELDKIEFEDQRKLLDLAIEENAVTMKRIELDHGLSPADKQDALNKKLEIELGLIQKKQNLTIAAEEITADQARLRGVKEKSGVITTEEARRFNVKDDSQKYGVKDKLDKSPTSVIGNITEDLHKFSDSFGTVAQQIARTFTNVIGTAVKSVSAGISGLIRGTMTWGQVLNNVGTAIMNVVIQAIVDMFAAWVTGRGTVTVAELAAQAVELPGKVIDAVATAISTYGTAAVVGLALALAALGAAAAWAAGAFSEGGYTGPGATSAVAGVVHRGEFVMSAPAVSRIGLANLEALHSGGAMPTGGPGGETHQHFAILDSPDKLPNWARSTVGEQWVIDVANRNWHKIG